MMVQTQGFHEDIHELYQKLQKDQAQAIQGNDDLKENENKNIQQSSPFIDLQQTSPFSKTNNKKKKNKSKKTISLQYNELPTKNKLLPKIRVADDQLQMLKINNKQSIFNSQKTRRQLNSSSKKRLRQKLISRIRSIQDQNQKNSNPILKPALQMGIGKNAKEVEQKIANLAIQGYYFSHESNQVIKDKETPSKRKLQFITETEKIKNNYKKQMENVVRDFDQDEFITNMNNTEFDKSKIIGKQALPNQLKCMNDMKKPSVRGALISRLREKNQIGQDINVILKSNKELRLRNREKNSNFFKKQNVKGKGGDGGDDDDDDDDQDYNPNEDSEEGDNIQDKLSQDENNDKAVVQKLVVQEQKKNITIDDILKLQGDGDVLMKDQGNKMDDQNQDEKQQQQQQQGQQEEELALGADNGGGYEEQASYFIKNQNKSMSETNDLKPLPNAMNTTTAYNLGQILLQVKHEEEGSNFKIQQVQLKQNASQLTQKSTGQANDEKTNNNNNNNTNVVDVDAQITIKKKKKKKINPKINFFLQDQAQLGSDNQEHDNICYQDMFGDDDDEEEEDEDDQDEEDLIDLIDNSNNINPNDQNQVKNRMEVYLKNQQRDQELENQNILDLVMGKKREEQSSRANAENNRKIDFLIKMETEQYNKEEEARKRAQAQLNQYYQREMRQKGERYEEDGENSEYENERQNQIQNRKIQLNARKSKIAAAATINRPSAIRNLSQFNGNAEFSINITNFRGGNYMKGKTQQNIATTPQQAKSFSSLNLRQKSYNSIMIQKEKFNRTQNIIQKMRINAGIKQTKQDEKLEKGKTRVVFNNKGKPFNQADSKRKKNKVEKGNKLLEFKP